MKILAMEIEAESIRLEKSQPHLKAEARRVWELDQTSAIRELYFRADRATAVLILECMEDQAHQVLSSLPLVRAA